MSVFSEIHMALLESCDNGLADQWEIVSARREGLWEQELHQIEWITGFFSYHFIRQHLTEAQHQKAIHSLAEATDNKSFMLAFKTHLIPIFREDPTLTILP